MVLSLNREAQWNDSRCSDSGSEEAVVFVFEFRVVPLIFELGQS